jgi:hypothetical protein
VGEEVILAFGQLDEPLRIRAAHGVVEWTQSSRGVMAMMVEHARRS